MERIIISNTLEPGSFDKSSNLVIFKLRDIDITRAKFAEELGDSQSDFSTIRYWDAEAQFYDDSVPCIDDILDTLDELAVDGESGALVVEARKRYENEAWFEWPHSLEFDLPRIKAMVAMRNDGEEISDTDCDSIGVDIQEIEYSTTDLTHSACLGDDIIQSQPIPYEALKAMSRESS